MRKKLTLNKQTIRNLSDNELNDAAGGRPVPTENTTCCKPCDASDLTVLCSEHGSRCYSYMQCVSDYC